MPSISLPVALIGAAGIGAAGSLGAASAQSSAAKSAAQVQQNMFNKTQANLQPFIASGPNVLAALQAGTGTEAGGTGTGPLNAPFNPANLAQTSGDQFILQQGENAILDRQSSLGGVLGGNTLKAMTEYAQGLASTMYQQQFQDYMAQQQQQFGQLYDLASLSENAAAGLGNTSAQVGANIGQDITGAGNATSAGIVGATNAITGGLTQNYLLSQLLQSGGYGGIGAAEDMSVYY